MANTSLREGKKSFLQIIFVGNPLTMFLFNLFAPQKAVRFVFQPKFGRLMRNCYGFFANLMPFRWNKYWMEQIGIVNYSPRQQVRYCLEFRCEPETLKLMSEEALHLLWQRRSKLKNKEQRLAHAILFIKAGRLTDNRFAELLRLNEIDIVRAYVRRGAISKKQLKMLTLKTACDDPEANYRQASVKHKLNENFLLILVNYAKKYSLTSECLQIVHHTSIVSPDSEKLKKNVNEAVNIYSQRVYTVSQRSETNVAAWRAFCKQASQIYSESQMQMNPEQYRAFHETGHKMSIEAILYFVSKVNKDMCRLIFQYEPDQGVSDPEVYSLVNAIPEIRNIFYQVLSESSDAEEK